MTGGLRVYRQPNKFMSARAIALAVKTLVRGLDGSTVREANCELARKLLSHLLSSKHLVSFDFDWAGAAKKHSRASEAAHLDKLCRRYA